MNRKRIERANRGFGFIEIILVLAVILFLCYKLLVLYFKEPIVDKENQKILLEQGIETTNSKVIIDSAKKNIEKYNLNVENQNKGLENIE